MRPQSAGDALLPVVGGFQFGGGSRDCNERGFMKDIIIEEEFKDTAESYEEEGLRETLEQLLILVE